MESLAPERNQYQNFCTTIHLIFIVELAEQLTEELTEQYLKIMTKLLTELQRGLNKNYLLFLELLPTHEGNRAPEYITAIGVSERTMERYLQQLKEAGLIEFKGEAAQTGGYYLTKKMKGKLK